MRIKGGARRRKCFVLNTCQLARPRRWAEGFWINKLNMNNRMKTDANKKMNAHGIRACANSIPRLSGASLLSYSNCEELHFSLLFKH